MKKLFVYNFGGYIYESHEAFDSTYRALRNEALENGETITRQVIVGDTIRNEKYVNGCWMED